MNTDSTRQPQVEVARASRWNVLSLFTFAHFAEHLATALLTPLLPFIRAEFGLSYFQAGLVLSAHAIVSGVANLPAGWLADRVSLRWMMGASMAGTTLATLAIGAVAGFWPLLALVTVTAIFSGCYHPIATSFLSSYFRAGQRGRALGFHLIGGSLGTTVAPLLGGVIAELLGWRYAFVFLAIPGLASVPFYFRLRLDRGQLPEEAARSTASTTSATAGTAPSLVQSLRSIALIFSLFTAMQLITVGVTSLLPVFLVDERLVAPAAAAMMLALIRGGGLPGGPLGGWASDRLGRKGTVILSLVATGPLLLSVVLLPVGAGLMAAMLVLGAFMQFKQPAIQSLVAEAAPPGRLSTMLGFYFFFSSEVRSLMVPVIGLSMDLFGLAPTFTGLGVAAVGLSIAALLLRRRV